MKINWNWGTGLFIGASLFILMIGVFAYFMFKQSNDLVEKYYYPKALVFQQRIDKLNNTAQMAEKAAVESLGSFVVIRFPHAFNPDSITGTVQFYRPSGISGDVNVPVKLNSAGVMTFPMSGLIKGKYLVKLDYSCAGIGYYQEEVLFVP